MLGVVDNLLCSLISWSVLCCCFSSLPLQRVMRWEPIIQPSQLSGPVRHLPGSDSSCPWTLFHLFMLAIYFFALFIPNGILLMPPCNFCYFKNIFFTFNFDKLEIIRNIRIVKYTSTHPQTKIKSYHFAMFASSVYIYILLLLIFSRETGAV